MWRLALPRFIERKSLLDAALVTLTVVFGLQELRVLLTGLVFYIRDSLGAHTVIPGVHALALFLIAFLAARKYVVLGPKRALLLTSGGLALVRLAEQVIPCPSGTLASAPSALPCSSCSYAPTWAARAEAGPTTG